MEFCLLQVGCPEMEYLWSYLDNHPLNEGIEQPSVALNGNEVWQYVGSYKQGDVIIHAMRHLHHPRYNRTEYVSVRASTGFTSDQIAKSFKA